MVTLSLKSETTNAKGKMNPCHSPSQKPATEPSAPGEFLKMFGPAVQPAERHRTNKRKRPKTATSGFFTIPPRERSGMNRQILTQHCCPCVGHKVILAKRFGCPSQSWQDKNGPPAREKRPTQDVQAQRSARPPTALVGPQISGRARLATRRPRLDL